ncbi:MAG: hypothetical protein ACR2QM_17625 [Longimicrobiales bacterium]
MSLRSGVPGEFTRVARLGSKVAAQFKASQIRSKGLKARVIADPENNSWVVFQGPARRRAPQKRWQA